MVNINIRNTHILSDLLQFSPKIHHYSQFISWLVLLLLYFVVGVDVDVDVCDCECCC